MSIVAVDIGNSRIKIGWFDLPLQRSREKPLCLPQPRGILALPTADWSDSTLANWSAEIPPTTPWWIASVNRPAATRLTNWVQQRYPARQLSHVDLPIVATVEHPERVGIDRLAGAVAANELRQPQRPAIVIGVGSAITVDLISADGVFRGGAILPGIGMSARALDEFTDLLPRSPLEELAGAAGVGHFDADGDSQRPVLGCGRCNARTGRQTLRATRPRIAPAGSVFNRRGGGFGRGTARSGGAIC